jgi:hypothetical protein
MERQCAVPPRDVVRDRLGLVRRQPVQDQMQGPTSAAHHPLQRNEQLAIQPAGIGCEPERPLGTDRRDGADALGLAGDRYHRGLSLAPQAVPCTASARKPDSSQK